jgi:hypothetical protein
LIEFNVIGPTAGAAVLTLPKGLVITTAEKTTNDTTRIFNVFDTVSLPMGGRVA